MVQKAAPGRAFVFNIVFYLNLLVHMLAAIPLFLFPRRYLRILINAWCRSSLWWMKVLVGTDYKVRGRSNIPDGPIIVAAKHQSFWETFALLPLFTEPTIILKRELTWIPLFGWLLIKYGCIAVDRRAGPKALRAMLADARNAASEGRQIIIFPEGTRKEPGAAPDYKPGIHLIYTKLAESCLPIALNSGLFWPRRRPERYSGTILVEILAPIAPGLPRKEFLNRLEMDIETATARLVAEARGE